MQSDYTPLNINLTDILSKMEDESSSLLQTIVEMEEGLSKSIQFSKVLALEYAKRSSHKLSGFSLNNNWVSSRNENKLGL